MDFIGRVESLPSEWAKLMRAMSRRVGIEPLPDSLARLELRPTETAAADVRANAGQGQGSASGSDSASASASLRLARAEALLVGRTEGPNQVLSSVLAHLVNIGI